jgi:hypothetical protein
VFRLCSSPQDNLGKSRAEDWFNNSLEALVALGEVVERTGGFLGNFQDGFIGKGSEGHN